MRPGSSCARSEGLPVSFLEAAVHRCAILSPHDPEDFTSRFGYHAGHGELEEGLSYLLEVGRWRAKGEAGHAYVSEFHEKEKVIDLHVEAYERLMEP